MESDAYHVITVNPDSAVGPQGNMVAGYRVDFRTKHGHRSFVQVPRTEDWPEEAHAAIMAETERLDRFHAKTPSTHHR